MGYTSYLLLCTTRAILLYCAATLVGSAETLRTLQVKGDVLTAVKCRADDDVGFVRMGLKLHLLNVGTDTITIRQVGPISTAFVARSIGDLHSRKYEHEYSFTTMGPVNAEASVPKASLLLRPQQTYAFERRVELPIWLSSGPGGEFGVKPGDHALSVTLTIRMDTPSGGSKLEGSVTDNEQSNGYILRSIPTAFSIDDISASRGCSNNR